ncbi:hypothetical protein DXT89_13295 [Agrobacterium vitis]|uniref:Uncharacterized protein n=1 Tax=Agrobacterium vitis TaxID=373 RepID=A0A368NRT8_AGRVI|nr:hypothetical protein DXM22_07300 [Agrobacterium vitis]KAA3526921.1 hypothetical protein DXT89_13295 [Agrobacterium vitis]RCU53108.1 hypothetical protein ASB66_015625 [Agrobacterium vitis]
MAELREQTLRAASSKHRQNKAWGRATCLFSPAGRRWRQPDEGGEATNQPPSNLNVFPKFIQDLTQ